MIEDNGKIKIQVQHKGKTESFYPEEISAMVLEKMKQTAEAYVGTTIKDVVITVPAYFNNTQRVSTKFAAEIAGMNVLRMINEPTAAAFAYGLNTFETGAKNILIFDFGGGTFDVTILVVNDKNFDVRATSGDPHLGGEDLDIRMVNYFVEEFKRKFDQDISGDKGLLYVLKTRCEEAKRVLSVSKSAEFKLDGRNLVGTISRSRFEDLCSDLFQKTINLVGKALEDAGMTTEEIDEIVLVGGSSRIPMVQDLLSEYFQGKALNKRINPDECVAYGAAVQAAMLKNDPSILINDMSLSDVCPLSLGAKVKDGSVSVVIKRNTKIPCKKTDTFFTSFDYQESAKIEIYEGERVMAVDNHLVDSFVFDGIPPAPRGAVIEKTFEIDENGILKVTAVEPKTQKAMEVIIENSNRLSEKEVEEIAAKAADFRAQDEEHRERLAASNRFEERWYKIKREVERLTGVSKTMGLAKMKEFRDWLDTNVESTKDDLDAKYTELEAFWDKMNS